MRTIYGEADRDSVEVSEAEFTEKLLRQSTYDDGDVAEVTGITALVFRSSGSVSFVLPDGSTVSFVDGAAVGSAQHTV